jgi:RNA polymerase sigma-70 factor, ECF subfamily
MTEPAPVRTAQAIEPSLYAELRQIAQAVFAGEASGHTLSRTAVIHEAWLRLSNQPALPERADYLRLAARVMRNVLVDHARARNAAKRGGGHAITQLDQTLHHYAQLCATGLYMPSTPTEAVARVERELDVEALDAAISALAQQSARQAEIVELKFFAGLGNEEIAAELGTSRSTIKREWTVARLFLLRELMRARAAHDSTPA